MYKVKLAKSLTAEKVQCTACQRYCCIGPGGVGFCLSRKNIKGQLYSLNYGFSSGIAVDPIEKKPLYHFYPGSQVLSIGSWGCNFRCKQCQNWHCSWGEAATRKLKDLSTYSSSVSEKSSQESSLSTLRRDRTINNYVSPKALVELAVSQGYPGIAFTYNEPAIWPEYVYDAAKLAKKNHLYTVFVSNGSWTRESLKLYGPFIDAANIDLKGWGEQVYARQGAFWGQILDNLVLACKKYKIHLELTTLVIPGINDNPKDLKAVADWIVKNLGPQIPWHLSRYSPERAPDKEFVKIPPTSTKTLKQAYEIGKKAGLHFVYVWAPPDSGEEFFSLGDTYCPKCNRLVIKRSGWQPDLTNIKKIGNKGVCQFCQTDLYLKI
jgi:pyruvate formate lyase activating enzyme